MTVNPIFPLCTLWLLLVGCAKPLYIDVEQAPSQIAVSSTVLDAHTLLLTATQSVNSLTNLTDGGAAQSLLGLADGMLLSDAVVLLRTGVHTDTLRPLYAGIYGAYDLQLIPYQSYGLSLQDKRTGTTVTSTAIYLPMTAVDTLAPEVIRTQTDTTVNLRLVMQDDPDRTDYYIMSYSKLNSATVPSAFGGSGFAALAANPAKHVELFTDADLDKGRIRRSFSLDIRPTDTLYVHLGRIEKGYFDYLAAYKRTGSLLTQLVNEPISLPTNIIPGLGYFSLYEVNRSAFVLKKY